MQRRKFLFRSIAGLASLAALGRSAQAAAQVPKPESTEKIEKISKTPEEWRKVLTPVQFNILREEGTERPYSSPLNDEKRKGSFACAGCDLVLFESSRKYDSGTGWPSFWAAIPGRVAQKSDYKLIMPRQEYHCARCGGHQGHVFDDGPKPTGLRYCNNGVALKFVPA